MTNPSRIPVVFIVLLLAALAVSADGQTLSDRPHGAAHIQATPTPEPASLPSIELAVPVGTPLKVALDQEVRVRELGQVVHGRLTEPVYSFNKLVIPAGSEVSGKISSLGDVPKMRRTMAALDADFSPTRRVEIEFTELTLPDGRKIPLQTVVSPGSQGVLEFVPAGNKATGPTPSGLASRKISEARKQAHDQVQMIKKQLHDPGKMHRIKRMAIAQLPYRPQYIDAGTGFNADLQRPLKFGSESLRPEMVSAIGEPLPSGSVIHALLITPLSSATSKKGDLVDAVISQPLVVSDKLILPEGSHLQGEVLQVQRARRLERNGQLRIVFHKVVPPDGLEQKIEASLEGVEVAKGEHLALDAEGGAQVTAPRTRYLTTGIAVMLAASSVSEGDHDAGDVGRDGGGAGKGAATGASGFKLVGMLVGALAHSRAVNSSLGFYGAGLSIYSHFLARGRDVVYPKDMSMVVGLGTREATNQVQTRSNDTSARLIDNPMGSH
ncbi:MAG: hypothetical protein ACRD2U_11455 [Terriglobales bacterium]